MLTREEIPQALLSRHATVVEGLEPVWPRGVGEPPCWRLPTAWFRWFASGDLLVLALLLALKELR